MSSPSLGKNKPHKADASDSPAETVRMLIRIKGVPRWVDLSRKELLRISMAQQVADTVMHLLKTVHRTEKGEKVDLTGSHQWHEIWADACPDLRVMSSAQVGKTFYGIVRQFASAELGLNHGFIMPTDDARNRFVKEKVNPTIEAVSHYMERMRGSTGVGSVRLKKYRHATGEATLFYPGCNSGHDMRSFSADSMNVDEYDHCPRDNLALYPKRMNYSPFALTYETSTPTMAGDSESVPASERADNIHTRVLAGTDKHYKIDCEHCGVVQELEWAKHFVDEDLDSAGRLIGFKVRDPIYDATGARDVHPVCLKCGKPMDRLRKGVWIPNNPGSKISSYTYNRLNSGIGRSMRELLDTYEKAIGNPTLMQIFWNYDIGRPFLNGNVKFTEDLFKRCMIPGFSCPERSDGPASCGIDVNVPFFDVQAAEYPANQTYRQRVTWAGKIQGEEALIARVRAMGTRFVCVDQQPELNTALRLQAEFIKHGIWCTLVRYSSHPATKMITVSLAGEREYDPPLQVTVDRTACIDAHYTDMLMGAIGLPCNWSSLQDGRVKNEYLKPVRATVKNLETGIETPSWVGKPDHSVHAGVLNRIAGILGAQFLYTRGWDEVLMIRHDAAAKPTAPKPTASGRDEEGPILILKG